jgi:hypothetical protein
MAKEAVETTPSVPLKRNLAAQTPAQQGFPAADAGKMQMSQFSLLQSISSSAI